MLPGWDSTRIGKRIPGINIALIGGRRMGKSTATAHLLLENAERFDLVVGFVGSAACNPVLLAMMDFGWLPRENSELLASPITYTPYSSLQFDQAK